MKTVIDRLTNLGKRNGGLHNGSLRNDAFNSKSFGELQDKETEMILILLMVILTIAFSITPFLLDRDDTDDIVKLP